MKTIESLNRINMRLYAATLFSLLLTSCGGGGTVSGSGSGSGGASNGGTLITDIKIVNTTGSTQTNIPFTFGHAFIVGDVAAGNSLTGKLSNNALIPLQVNIKAKHTLGDSARHAVISGVLPSLAANATETVSLYTSTPLSNAPITAATFLSTNPGFSSRVDIRIGAEVYSASARELLADMAVNKIQWLAGSTVNEWIVAGPLRKVSDNAPHPHLTARFAIRSFTGSNKTKVDVTVENSRTFTAGSQNFTYDSKIFVGGVEVDTITGLTHYHHARWHKSFWWGDSPQVHIKHNTAYLIATKAVSNYDPSVTPSPTAIAQLATTIAGRTGPMKIGLLTYEGMGTGGGRPDIGPLPGWYVLYLLSMDKVAKDAMLATADSAGSWPVHFRDETTTGILSAPSDMTKTFDMPVRIDKAGVPPSEPITKAFRDYKYITIHENAFGTGPIPSTPVPCRIFDSRPECIVPLRPDTAHQPAIAYLPYLVTGDYFYLEELQFWAAWNFLGVGAGYREEDKGLLNWQEVRGTAWSLRTLGQAAYITPDDHPLKTYYSARVINNIKYYDDFYRVGNHNQLGVVLSTLDTPTTHTRPWMDDFFTWSIGYLVELGFTEAQPLLTWKSKYVVGRMSAPYCWTLASAFIIKIRPTQDSPMYSTFADVYANSFGIAGVQNTGTLSSKACATQEMADWLTANSTNTGFFDNWGSGTWVPNAMIGYAGEPIGMPANMQPALAISVTAGSAQWSTFIGRAGKPDYSSQPQFAIVPR